MQRVTIVIGFLIAIFCARLGCDTSVHATRYLPICAMCAIAVSVYLAGLWEVRFAREGDRHGPFQAKIDK